MEFDAFFGQFLRLVGRGLAIDRAMLDLTVMHLARLVGKFRPDIVRILRQVVAQLLELGAEFLLLRRHHRHRCGFGSRSRRGRLAALAAGGDLRRHQRLLDLGRAAARTGDKAALRLLVVGGRILEPAVEVVPAVAGEGVADHP
jgi:hypothetical protein